MKQIHLKTPSRLHFGLLGWGESGQRQFGGLGLMIQDPGLELRLKYADDYQAIGPHSERAMAIARTVIKRFKERGDDCGPVHIEIVNAPELHNGLGVGTQLSLAVGRALASLLEIDDIKNDELAVTTGRGIRSGIGIHGFCAGGLIVDAGRRGDQIPPRVLRLDFPDDWFILIVNPSKHMGLHGKAEIEAFRELPPIPDQLTDRLCGMILQGLVPAVIEHDLKGFGQSLTEVQEKVGRCFAPAQGGLYSSQETELVVQWLRKSGLHGVGQSSWGPALYGFSAAPLGERSLIRSDVIQHFQIADECVFWTRADNQGARILSE